MTCQELQCYLENPLRVEIYAYRESLPAAVSEHLAECEECARLFEEQKALGIGLEMAREAAPEVPAEFSAKVLENYRQQIARPWDVGRRSAWSFSEPWLRWTAAAAALIVIVTIALFLGHSRAPIVSKKIAPAEKKITLAAKQENADLPKEAVIEEKPKSAERVRRTAANANGSPLPPGFTSLMYCDEMTCTGAMEVIRVELPPPAGQAMNPAAAPVLAEVLVGEDGIARGIRILQ